MLILIKYAYMFTEVTASTNTHNQRAGPTPHDTAPPRGPQLPTHHTLAGGINQRLDLRLRLSEHRLGDVQAIKPSNQQDRRQHLPRSVEVE
jgi:hypothetical protein